MLDPSYLRSIRDGILSSNIEVNNNEALPDGLVGLYDKELFPPTLKWKERKERLEFFLVFAMAQKEISADFVAANLGDEWSDFYDLENSVEEYRLKKVNDLIQQHSKLFSSAGNGKYRLYHDRFRVYILQKVSELDFKLINEKFIALCEKALEVNSEKDILEKESYALEFISTHYFMSAMQGETECLNKEHALALKKYTYDQKFWERQIKASKGFEWSKKMLNQMITWTSKFNEDEEVIECALNKLDLYHQEQNDAPRIVQLVADGDIETALERIEKFGGDDKEGLQRKFILYMLCLMELTLLDSKDKDYAKIGIEKILKHFDEYIPANQPHLINWNDFYPSYLMFQMVCEWAELGLDYGLVYKRTDSWDSEWIKEKGPFTDIQFAVLRNTALGFNNIKYLKCICIELYKQSKIEEAASVIMQAKNSALCLKIVSSKVNELVDISSEMAKYGMNNEALLVLKEALEISENNIDNSSLEKIAIEFAKQGMLDEAISCANKIKGSDCQKSNILGIIIIEYSRQGKLEKAFEIIQGIENLNQRDRLLDKITNIYYESGNYIALQIAKLGRFDDALKVARGISDKAIKCKLLENISSELFLKNKTAFARSVIQEAISCALSLADYGIDFQNKSILLKDIAIVLAKRGDTTYAIELAKKIDKYYKYEAIKEIAFELFINGSKKEALKCITENIEDHYEKAWTKQLVTGNSLITAEELLSLFPSNVDIRFDAILKQIIFENYQISNQLLDCLLTTFNGMRGHHQCLVSLEISKSISKLTNSEIIEKINIIRFDSESYGHPSYSSMDLRMNIFKSLLLIKWQGNRYEVKDLIYLYFFNQNINTVQPISKSYIENWPSQAFIRILEKLNDLNSGDYYYMGSNTSDNLELLISIILHPKTHNNKFYVLQGFIENYNNIYNSDIIKLICFTFQYPSLLKKLLKKQGFI